MPKVSKPIQKPWKCSPGGRQVRCATANRFLEQLLAFSPGRITLEEVHGMLGTAGDSLLMGMVRHIVDRQPAAALADFDAALHAELMQPCLVEQLFGYFRDCMAAAAGCGKESFLYVSPSSANDIVEAGKKLGLQTILAMMQILDQTLSRMRYSTQGRIIGRIGAGANLPSRRPR